jgi:NADH-quinone oxidoreductase subunit C
MDDELQTIATKLAVGAPGAVVKSVFAFGELTLTVDAARILETLQFLRDDPAAQFVSIIDISGVDHPQREKRFDVVYHLLSPKLNRRIRVKVATDVDTPIMSATPVYPGADWYEREVYDLFGVRYEPVRLNQEFRQFDFLSPWEGPPLPGDEKAKDEGRQ